MTAKRSIDGGGFDIVKQQVPLNRINRIMKDINVILGSTEEDVVATSTSISADGGTETFTGNSDMFFLQLASRLQGEDWQLDIAKAFAKAGYAIKKDYWAD
ncbi:MAG: hypothetical protein K0S09_2324 [Sphingobacteriaceae bacterium]|nr:hypothetical protein [Sphingobacteriaceae bacterium]